METDAELKPQENGFNSLESGTRPSTRHQAMTCKLSERGVEARDSRLLSEAVNKAITGDSIEWTAFE